MAIVSYNGHKPSLIERIRLPAPRGVGIKAAPFPVSREYLLPSAYWFDNTARAYFEQGYKINSAVYACTRALATGFAEAPLRVYSDETKKKPQDNHPVRKLLKRPNELMGEDEFWRYWITYAANGGNAYGVIIPNNGGRPGEIWPYNDTKVHPVSSSRNWIDHYTYKEDGSTYKEDLGSEKVIHYKWAIDPLCEYKGLSALAPVAREVATDNELTRYLKALLQNDAVPRTIITPSPDKPVTPDLMEKIKADFKRLFSGENRGDVAIATPGAEINRLALNLEELAFDALRGVPEARIASAYGVPAIVAGLNIGLARSTYSNFEEARRMFTEQTLVPLWKAVASEFQQSLVPLFGNDVYVDFDLSGVRALTDNIAVKSVWVISAWKEGIFTLNQTLNALGEEEIGPEGDERKAPPPPPQPPTPPQAQQAEQAPGGPTQETVEEPQADVERLAA